MALITWTNLYSVNVAEIDAQHMKLVDLLNKLYDASKQGIGKETLAGVFNELVEYTAIHFQTEEALMKRAGYLDYNEHKAVHTSLVQHVKKLQQNYLQEKDSTLNDTITFLRDWILKHIAGTDKKYTESLNAAGIK